MGRLTDALPISQTSALEQSGLERWYLGFLECKFHHLNHLKLKFGICYDHDCSGWKLVANWRSSTADDDHKTWCRREKMGKEPSVGACFR